jgi:hypothetical protein
MVYNVFSAEWITLHLMVTGLQVNNSSNNYYKLRISTPKRRTKSHVMSRRKCILVTHISIFSVLICHLFHTLIRFVKCIKFNKCTLILVTMIIIKLKLICSYILNTCSVFTSVNWEKHKYHTKINNEASLCINKVVCIVGNSQNKAYVYVSSPELSMR